MRFLVALFLLATGYAGSPEAGANEVARLQRRAERRENR